MTGHTPWGKVKSKQGVVLDWGSGRVEPRDGVELRSDAQIGAEFALDGVRWQIVGQLREDSGHGLRSLQPFACSIAPVEIPTSVTTTFVPSDKLRELADRMKHLDSARTARQKIETGIEAGDAIELDAEEKRVTLDVVRHWLNEVGIDELGDALAELRYELIVDLDKLES